MRCLLIVTLCLGLTFGGGSRAKAADAEPDVFAAAQTHLQKGRIEEAREAFEELAEAKADPLRVAVGMSRCAQAEGELGQGATILEAALKAAPKSAELWARLAEVQFQQGQYEASEKSAGKAIELDAELPLPRLVRADVYTQTGRITQADEEYRWFVRYYNRAQPKDAETLLLVGRGSAQYARWHNGSQIFNFVVNTLCPDALAADKESWQASLLSGELLLEKYNRAQALPEFRQALTVNPRAAEVFAALGRASLQEYEIAEATEFATKALEVNPHLVSALQLRADLELNDGHTAEALKHLEEARKTNPRDQHTLARVAACYLIEDGVPPAAELDAVLAHLDAVAEVRLKAPSRFSKLVLELAKGNPRPAYFLTLLGTTLEGRRKFDLAERFYSLAIKTMPQLSEPKTALGMLYMRVGRSADARKLLDSAFEADPYHVRVSNMRKVLTLLEGYESITTDHFVIRFDSAADKLLAGYMAEYLEEQYPLLVAQFQFEPETRTQFEIYNSAKGLSAHQWFSARMVGLPWIQTIGASTGMMVALASPSAQDQQFNWARVLKHEFIHILTLQQTHFNIPHWFTEALATMNEGYPRQARWDRLLQERSAKGDLMTLDTINQGFIRPKTPDDWQLAYCQSELYAQYMIEKFGQQSIPRLLEAYRANLSTDQAIPKVFGIDKAEFEKGYNEYLGRIISELAASSGDEPEESLAELEKAHLAKPEDAHAAARFARGLLDAKRLKEARDLAEEALRADSKEPVAALVMAKLEMRSQDTSAAAELLEGVLDREHPHADVLELLAALHVQQEEFEKAAELYELGRRQVPSKSVWLKGLAVCYLKLDNDDKLSETLKLLVDRDPDDPAIRKKLAELSLAKGEFAAGLEAARSALQIDVQDAEIHQLLGEAHSGLKKFDRAAKEYAVAVELKPDDAELQLSLAQAQVAAKQPDEARAVLQKLLKAEPGNAAAKKLLNTLKPAGK